MSFKLQSRLITLIFGLITILSVLDIQAWQTILPQKYIALAPAIVAGIGFIASQLSEETRVNHAIDNVHKQYVFDNVVEETTEPLELGSDSDDTA